MLIQAMTVEECWAMLARNNIARLACARDNQPYIVPLRVDLDGQFLYGYTALGRKIEWMRTNPLVCLECEEVTTDRVWASLIVFGHYEELPHIPETRTPAGWPTDSFRGIPCGGNPRRFPLAVMKDVLPLCSAFTSTASPAAAPFTSRARASVKPTPPNRDGLAG